MMLYFDATLLKKEMSKDIYAKMTDQQKADAVNAPGFGTATRKLTPKGKIIALGTLALMRAANGDDKVKATWVPLASALMTALVGADAMLAKEDVLAFPELVNAGLLKQEEADSPWEKPNASMWECWYGADEAPCDEGTIGRARCF